MMKLDKELSVALKATELANKVIMDLTNKRSKQNEHIYNRSDNQKAS